MVMNNKRTPGRLLFGWCTQYAEDHDNCRTSFVDANGKERVCQCDCHNPSKNKKGVRSSKTGKK